jgi:hypothetical protein
MIGEMVSDKNSEGEVELPVVDEKKGTKRKETIGKNVR